MKDKEQRQAEAKERQEGYASLTKEQKIGMLDRRFGEGKGAVKERAKIESASTKVAAPEKKSKRSKKRDEKTAEESN